MPTYQYACTDCDHAFEQVQSFSEDSLTTCPQCEGRLRKIFNAVGVVFKGSGFYRTDNRADSKSSSATTSSVERHLDQERRGRVLGLVVVPPRPRARPAPPEAPSVRPVGRRVARASPGS